MQEKDKKVYMIDSENVGDLWVTHVIQLANAEDEILVFYTQKSPHMGYDTIIKLLDSSNKVQFIKCIEGRNALDFQLVTELGYRIGTQEEEKTYIIVTNDTGFDAVVQYWKMVNVEVRRYSAKYCQNQYNKKLCEDKLHPLVKNETDSNGQENIVQGEKELLLEEQLSLFGNQIGTKESQFGLPAKTETVRTTEIATKVEKTVAVEVSKKEEAPVVEEVSKTEEASVVEKVSKTEETPVVEKVSKTEETPVVEEVSKTEEAPVAVEVSKTEKAPVELKTVATAEKGIQVEMQTSISKKTENLAEGKEEKSETACEKAEKSSEEIDSAVVEDLLNKIVNCIGIQNNGVIHNALTIFLGNAGKTVYQKEKSNLKSYLKKKAWKKEERFRKYCQLVFAYGEVKLTCPKKVSTFVYEASEKRQNLNSFRSALIKEFGKEKGMLYYNMLKAHVKILNQIQENSAK